MYINYKPLLWCWWPSPISTANNGSLDPTTYKPNAVLPHVVTPPPMPTATSATTFKHNKPGSWIKKTRILGSTPYPVPRMPVTTRMTWHFSKESQPKPLFASVTWLGVAPKHTAQRKTWPSCFSIRLQPRIENPEWDSSANAGVISGIGLGCKEFFNLSSPEKIRTNQSSWAHGIKLDNI